MRIDAADWAKPENLKIIVPFVVTIYAFSMDVGYFVALGMGFFSLFTVTEHIGFAVQSIPAALVIVAFAAYATIMFQHVTKAEPTGDETAASGAAEGVAARVERIASRLGRAMVGIITFLLALLSIVLLVWVVARGPLYVLVAVGLLSTIASNWKHDVVRMGTIFAVSVVVAFASGFYTAVTQTTDRLYRIQTDSALEGRILVAGVQGLLVYDSRSCRTKFVRWTKDVLIEAKPAMFAYFHPAYLYGWFGVSDCEAFSKRGPDGA
jgi:hypothetical protein